MTFPMLGQAVDRRTLVKSAFALGAAAVASPFVITARAADTVKIGFANPLLYSLPRAAYQDVVPHRTLHYASVAASYLGTFNVGSTQRTARGYDNITGRGTPNGAILVRLESAF